MDQTGSDMLVDHEYDEKQGEVAIITPTDSDDQMDEVDADPEPRADEYDAFMKKHLPELPDQEAEAETHHTWEIKDWRTLMRKEHGPIFECGGQPWRILFFPYGNNVDFASFYLEQAYEENKMPEDWYACVQFMLVLWNPNDPSMYITHTAHHRFTADEGDWGFTRFAELRKLFANSWDDRGRPMVEGNAANVTAYIRVLKDPTGVLWHNFLNYDSKKETGMVGLKNQGATCYLNSLLQSLYFTNAFRQAVYQIPTDEDDKGSSYALQRLFYLLQNTNNAVSTTGLTHSFGWDSKQIFEQQDVQELSRVLMDNLDAKMKGSVAEGALERMFVGKMKTYISCINVDYESSRIEDYWDIQLNVSGNKNLDDSFKDYVQVETMDGENKYFAEGFGLQDARKGVIFESFPPVLHLQLKRFEYDFQRDAMMKVNDRYEFPEVWDASPYLSPGADRSEPYVYRLHSVLVHSGDLNAGHYYAFIKPTKDGHYYKFDDDRVTRATKREALEENFGGDYAQAANGNAGQRNPYTRTWSSKRSMSAYMLVYIRESRIDSILPDATSVAPPKHLAERIAEEHAAFEKKKKEREEAHLYMDIAVASEENFKAYQGFDIVPWKGDSETAAHPKVHRVRRSMTMAQFNTLVGQDLGIDGDMLRPWSMVNRQNGTIRPDTPLEFPDMTVEEASAKHGTKQSVFRLWMEKAAQRDADGAPMFGEKLLELKGVSDKPIMLFLKHFDANTQSLFGITTFYAGYQDRVSDLCPTISNNLNWPSGTQMKLSEEIKMSMIEVMKPKTTLAQSELQDGDIITVQRSLTEKEIEQIRSTGGYVDAKEFYEFLLNRINIEFVPRFQPEGVELSSFSLTLSKKMSYDQMAAKVAEYLQCEPTYLRFTTVSTAGKPKTAVKYNANHTLNNIMFPGPYSYAQASGQRPDALFYEKLDMSLKELEQRKPVKITWLPEGLQKEEEVALMIPKSAQVADLLDELQRKVNISDEVMNKVQIWEVSMHRFSKQLAAELQITALAEHSQIYAMPVPEIDAPQRVSVYHFDKDHTKAHGIPFQFALKEGEPFSETKQRLSDLTKIKGKQLDKIKFAKVPRAQYSKATYIEDDDEILWDTITDDQSLGLDHPNKSRSFWGKSDSIFIR
ncbi:cysteine proteinase [Macroventuria anomochaeta]|uniref:Cysteine proteinase n=1 Tax=Macroventuria anomochaeta TaxID=301207 RepID=A0ACB6RY81_9PLEO|nr:cysteine proteinase [Macroventuria anomochaeta]KAF2626733.1 cysteine proteinase [Macroventuria anomochaeta]